MAPKRRGPAEEEEIDPTKYRENRIQQLAVFAETQGKSIYPHKFHVSLPLKKYVETYGHLEPDTRLDDVTITVAGRIARLATAGASLKFYDLVSDGAKIQVMSDEKTHIDESISFLDIHALLRRGDYIGVEGHPGRTRRGELSIHPTKIVMLSPCLHMLPKSVQGLKDPEIRYRQRYLDLIVNSNVRPIFEIRSKAMKYLRNYLEERDFIEVETPTLNAIPGGAAARPFKTLHNDLNQTMFMRIAPELYLKMLVVGGMDRVFEIGKNFRNEGIDATHNPEFTAAEFYQAYADLYDLIDTTEDLVSKLVMDVNGGNAMLKHTEWTDGPEGPRTVKVEKEINFAPPYERLPMVETIEERSGVKLPRPLDGEECIKTMRQILYDNKVDLPKPSTAGKLLDKLCGFFIEDRIVNPTFVMEHPQISSPLAKWHRSKPEVTERGELFVNGKEIANFYTELNDPHFQLKAFQQQGKARDEGDDEACPIDEGYVLALEHALPPTGGWGLGIDRLVMLLADCDVIKEVILFPALRTPVVQQKGPKPADASEEKAPQ